MRSLRMGLFVLKYKLLLFIYNHHWIQLSVLLRLIYAGKVCFHKTFYNPSTHLPIYIRQPFIFLLLLCGNWHKGVWKGASIPNRMALRFGMNLRIYLHKDLCDQRDESIEMFAMNIYILSQHQNLTDVELLYHAILTNLRPTQIFPILSTKNILVTWNESYVFS